MTEPKLIHNWKELSEVPESPTHRLEIGEYNGWLICKKPEGENLSNSHTYLSTHTFYGSQYEYSTKLLQHCGFNIILANWDAEE